MATAILIKKECTFLINAISRIQQIISISQVCYNNPSGGNPGTVPPVIAPKNLDDPLTYTTNAVNQEVISLSLQGFISYLYVKAYNVAYPLNPTAAEYALISDIYKALNISVPPFING